MTESAPIARARAALALRRWDEAVREASRAIAAEPEEPTGYYLLAHALFSLTRSDEALSAVEAALSKAPAEAPLHVLRSDILRETDRTEEAMAAAQEALRLDPTDPDSHVAVGLSAAALGDRSLALAELEAARALDPSDARLHRLVGDRHLDLEDNAAAERAYRQALAREANNPLTLNNLGCALRARGHRRAATLAFKSALLLDPSMAEARRNTHQTMRGLVGSSSALGMLGVVAVALFKLKLVWLTLLLRVALFKPMGWMVLGALLGGGVVVALLVRWVRVWLLVRRDPQLMTIFRHLESDHKAKRL